MSTSPHRSPPVTSTLAHHAADPFRLMVESVKDYAIYMLDPSGHVASWNSGAERITGYKSEEILGRHVSLIYSAEDVSAGAPQASLQRALADGRHAEEGQRRRKDGTLFWATVTTTPLFDTLNHLIGFAKVTRDISEKRRAELALEESEESHRRLLEFMPDAVFVNAGGRIEYCNSTFAHLLGASGREDLVGRPVLSIFHPRYHQLISQRIETIQHHNGTVPLLEEEVVRLDGQVVPVEVAATAMSTSERPSILVVLRDIRRRKEVERRFSALIDEVKDYAIYTMDAQGIISTWNDGAARIFGYAAEETVGKHRGMLFSAEDVAAGAPQHEQDRAAAHGSASEERWRPRKDGSRFWANGSLTVLRDSNGLVQGFVKVVRDLSERKRAEAALRESEERYRNLFQAIADPMFVYDRETLGYLAVNDAAVQKYGYSRDEFLGMTIKDIRPPEDVTALLAMLATSGNSLEDRGLWRHRKKNGDVIEVEISAHGMIFSGRPACIVQARDVTEQRRAAVQAVRTNELLNAVADGTPDSVFVKDRDGKYLLLNAAAARSVGKPAAEVLGQDDTAVYSLEDARTIMANDRLVMESDLSQMFENVLVAHGTSRIFEATKAPYRDASGAVLGVIGISRDVTERKRAEEATRQSQALLRIAGRVARLGGWSLDLATQQASWSDEICAIHDMPVGYQPTLEDAIRFYPPEYRDQVADFVERLRRDGAPFDFEMELITAKGRRLWVRSIGEAVRGQDGRIVALQGAFQDISDRKQSEEEQRRLAARLTTTLESITDGFFILDREWRFAYFNAEAERMTLRQRASLLGATIWETFPETVDSTFERAYRRAMEQQTTVDFEEYFPPLSKWFGVRVYPSEQGLAVYFRDRTASRQAEQALVASEARFRTVIQSSWDVFQLVEPDGRIAYESPAVTRVLGYQPEEMLGRNIAEFVHPDDLLTIRPAEAEHETPSKPRTVILRVRHKDCSWRWVESYEVNLVDHPDVRAWAVNYRDITERKLAEQSLQASEQQQRELATALVNERQRLIAAQAVAKVGSWETDLATLDTTWSDETYRIFEQDPATFPPTHGRFLQLVHPEDRAAVDRAFQESRFQHAPQSIEHRLLLPGGGIKFVEERWQVTFDEHDHPVRVTGTCQDSTERKQSEVALRLRDQAIQEVSQGIVITDPKLPDNPIIYASAGVERITGYRSSEIVGRNCRMFQGKDTDQDQVQKLRQAIADGRSCAVEILNYRKDGTSFWNAMSINPVRDPQGTLCYFVGVQNDTTDRKVLESQLRQSQKMEAIGRLAGGVAHDFNNLLTVISGYSELLLAQPEMSGDVRDSIATIREAGERAAGLTRQLLGFSRQTLLQPKVLDLNAVVTETGKMLRRLIGEDILFTTVLDPQLSPIKVDPGQLDQVLMNLAVNARDAMPTGGRLRVETSNVLISDDYVATHLDLQAGRHVMLAMADTGCGMSPEIMARIFEPFYTTKEIGKGTGLGLAVVFGIVQQSGGAIHVDSQPGVGTTFKIYLPAVCEPVHGQEMLNAKERVAGTETVLLVEDEEGVRELARRCLQMHGYRVLTAKDGQDAWRVLRSHRGPLDLVLTDVVMPNVSGPQLAEALKAEFPHVGVLFMSGYTDDAVVRHGLLEADFALVQKPYTPRDLARKVRAVLDARTNPGG